MTEKQKFIFAKDLNNPEIKLVFNPDDTVENIKVKIKEQLTEKHAIVRRLIFAGKVMQDERILSDYYIYDGATLHYFISTPCRCCSSVDPNYNSRPKMNEDEILSILGISNLESFKDKISINDFNSVAMVVSLDNNKPFTDYTVENNITDYSPKFELAKNLFDSPILACFKENTDLKEIKSVNTTEYVPIKYEYTCTCNGECTYDCLYA
jgi:hypothetical protein